MTSTRTHLLSKTTYMRGHQCAKALSLYTHRRELMTPISPAQQAVFDNGTRMGLLAQQRFPGGVDLRPDSARDFRESLARTEAAIRDGATVLYEAAFVHDGVLAAVDILRREGDGWRAYEVKASTSVKPQHVDDAALQLHVLTACGLALDDISIVHINNQYVRQGELDVAALFQVVSVREQAQALLGAVPARIAALKAIVLSTEEPVVAIGRHCDKPYTCDFKAHCWQDVPTEVRGPRHVNAPALRSFLETLRYPLYFMDFETVNPAIPPFDGTRPYEQIPFQFSVHRQESPGAPVTHAAFLASGRGDSRAEFTEALLDAVGSAGDVLTYNLTFEATRIRALAATFPHHAAALEALLARCKDLIVPFKKGWYYDPAMGTSNSIKVVLPALVPEMTYDGLAIADGLDASQRFQALMDGQVPDGEVDTLRADLLKYCELDTMAMVRILAVLEGAAAA